MFFQSLKYLLIFLIAMLTTESCIKDEEIFESENEVLGFNLLNEISGHWVGKNETAFGVYDWFAFDFRPISSSHIHSIYEGASAMNIINSFFVAEYDGKHQIMARNGGWLGSQYRATYFLLDKAEENDDKKYYRLVDAIGGKDRSYIELTFENDKLKFDAYKDNSGTLDNPILHMSFTGTNYNPSFAEEATKANMFPKNIPEISMENQFDELLDNDSALFLEESLDPFPRSMHNYLSELTIDIEKNIELKNKPLLLYLSTKAIVENSGNINFEHLDKTLVRTIDIYGNEESYTATYLHPDEYYVTVFYDADNNKYPSEGDLSSESSFIDVEPESHTEMRTRLGVLISP